MGDKARWVHNWLEGASKQSGRESERQMERGGNRLKKKRNTHKLVVEGPNDTVDGRIESSREVNFCKDMYLHAPCTETGVRAWANMRVIDSSDM